MSTPSRIIIAIASLSMIAGYFLPIWFIFLLAPQYPEGLTMNIWIDNITGQVDIINGLNHYIGMKHIKVEMFPEFEYMIYILGFFILCGLIVAFVGKRKWLLGLIGLTLLGGIAAMYDFYIWGYDYGHNLDPKAAIQIPGFSYQPPLFGHKTLLNFDAYSYPDVGGWIIVAAASVFFIVWLFEWRKSRKASKKIPVVSRKSVPAVAALLIILSSCSTEPKPFKYGSDMCDDCRMAIADEKFGAQIITKKGKVFMFDDAFCVINFQKKGGVKKEDISKLVFIDFENKNSFTDANNAWFVVSPQIKSPMNSNAAAFSTKKAAEARAASMQGTLHTWNELMLAQ